MLKEVKQVMLMNKCLKKLFIHSTHIYKGSICAIRLIDSSLNSISFKNRKNQKIIFVCVFGFIFQSYFKHIFRHSAFKIQNCVEREDCRLRTWNMVVNLNHCVNNMEEFSLAFQTFYMLYTFKFNCL